MNISPTVRLSFLSPRKIRLVTLNALRMFMPSPFAVRGELVEPLTAPYWKHDLPFDRLRANG
jgi:hypothetical protein